MRAIAVAEQLAHRAQKAAGQRLESEPAEVLSAGSTQWLVCRRTCLNGVEGSRGFETHNM